MERDFFLNLYSKYFKPFSLRVECYTEHLTEGSIQSYRVRVCASYKPSLPPNRMHNINSRRLNNFLGAMCLEFRRTGIYHIKVSYSPCKQSSLCFLCSCFFLLISIVRVLHHCNTLQSAGGERMTDCLLLKGKVCASLQPAAASLLGKVLSAFSSLTFFFFSFSPSTLGNKAILDESQNLRF